jgi:hypothetical protein
MKKVLLIFGFLFCSNFGFAQIDIYRSHPSFIKSVNFNKNRPYFRNNLRFIQSKSIVFQYLPTKRDCYYLLTRQTSICFNQEINLDVIINEIIILQNENVKVLSLIIQKKRATLLKYGTFSIL